jgi:hypothetical protein
MQERPNRQVLLSAIARFLVEEARPALADPRLNFRALIAAHLATVVSAELASEDDLLLREIGRLRELFPDAPPPPESAEGRRALARELTARLALYLREGDPPAADLTRIAGALRESLRELLSIDNPRFDTSLDIE